MNLVFFVIINKKGCCDMKYYLIDMERSSLDNLCYWKSCRRGYTYDISDAGMYDESEAIKLCLEDIDKRTLMLPLTSN